MFKILPISPYSNGRSKDTLISKIKLVNPYTKLFRKEKLNYLKTDKIYFKITKVFHIFISYLYKEM